MNIISIFDKEKINIENKIPSEIILPPNVISICKKEINKYKFKKNFDIYKSTIYRIMDLINVKDIKGISDTTQFGILMADDNIPKYKIIALIEFSFLTALMDDIIAFDKILSKELIEDYISFNSSNIINKEFKKIYQELLNKTTSNLLKYELNKWYYLVLEAYIRIDVNECKGLTFDQMRAIRRAASFSDLFSIIMFDEKEADSLDIEDLPFFYSLLDDVYNIVACLNEFYSYEKEKIANEYTNYIWWLENNKDLNKIEASKIVIDIWEKSIINFNKNPLKEKCPKSFQNQILYISANNSFCYYCFRYRNPPQMPI